MKVHEPASVSFEFEMAPAHDAEPQRRANGCPSVQVAVMTPTQQAELESKYKGQFTEYAVVKKRAPPPNASTPKVIGPLDALLLWLSPPSAPSGP
jgi:hypothetical protein